MADWLMQQLEAKCRENYGRWPDSPYGQSALESDERGARHNGARVTDIVRLCEGARHEAGSPIYRRYRRGLETAVKAGKATAWRPGTSAYVFYWPVGLSEALRHEAGHANG